MDEIITDAELHEADEWVDGLMVQAIAGGLTVPLLRLVHLALEELKVVRAQRTTRCSFQPSGLSARTADDRLI